MTRAILLLGICLVMSGCGAFRKVSKLKQSHLVQVTQEHRKDSTGVKVDRSVTTTTERIDTTVTTPAHTIAQETPMNMDSLVNGMTAIKNDLIDVRLHLNPITGILSAVATVKARAIPVKLDRVTTKQNDITSQSSKQESILTRVKTEDERKTVDKEPMKIPVWLIIIMVVISVIGAALFWRNKRR